MAKKQNVSDNRNVPRSQPAGDEDDQDESLKDLSSEDELQDLEDNLVENDKKADC